MPKKFLQTRIWIVTLVKRARASICLKKLLQIIRRRHALQNLAIKALKPFINMHCFFLETTSIVCSVRASLEAALLLARGQHRHDEDRGCYPMSIYYVCTYYTHLWPQKFWTLEHCSGT